MVLIHRGIKVWLNDYEVEGLVPKETWSCYTGALSVVE